MFQNWFLISIHRINFEMNKSFLKYIWKTHPENLKLRKTRGWALGKSLMPNTRSMFSFSRHDEYLACFLSNPPPPVLALPPPIIIIYAAWWSLAATVRSVSFLANVKRRNLTLAFTFSLRSLPHVIRLRHGSNEDDLRRNEQVKDNLNHD